MKATLCAITFTLTTLHCRASPVDTVELERQDTLNTVVVSARYNLAVVDAIGLSLKANQQPRVPSLGDILNKFYPQLMDRILHPFAIKERRKERRQKRFKKAMLQYENTVTPNELLLEAIRAEQERDSLLKVSQ